VKPIAALLILIAISACSSSDDSSVGNNELLGTWLSNCHEFLNTDNGFGENLHAISELTFSAEDYTDRTTFFVDMLCVDQMNVEVGTTEYVVGDIVATTDGLSATRLTITPLLPQRPDLQVSVDVVYRVSDGELHFGEYIDNEIPSIDPRVTYIRQ